MTDPESRAHQTIVDTIESVKGRNLHRYLASVLDEPLRVFAPRCNCGRPLNFSNTSAGIRHAWCEACRWRFKECE